MPKSEISVPSLSEQDTGLCQVNAIGISPD
jgi:hypothetical protein